MQESYSEKLVQRVNELYHDLTSDIYHDSHPEIFEQEKARWEKIAKEFLNFPRPLTVLDVGTGTGFVPLTAAKFLKKEDLFVCSDISRGMLDAARRHIDELNFSCQFKFIKMESQTAFHLPFEAKSIDVITINSVLHHIQDIGNFLNEIDRVLKPNGLVFVAHEPNKYFYDHKFLWPNCILVSRLLKPKAILYKILSKLGLKKVAKNLYYFIYPKRKKAAPEADKITLQINKILLEEKLIERQLLPEEIEQIRSIKGREGFKPDLLLPNYQLLHLETHNHLFKVSTHYRNNFIIRKYDSLLGKLYPQKGAVFFAVFKK